MNFFNARLGEILMTAGVLTQAQLNEALAAQKESHLRLGEQLISSNIITEQQLCNALRDQLHIPYVALQGMNIDPAVTALVPEILARRSNLIPFDRKGNTLCVAVSDPMDYSGTREVEITTGLQCEIYIAEASVIRDKVHEAYTNEKVYAAARALADTPQVEQAAAAPETDDDQPIIRFVNNMLEQAIIMKASDIHIEPGPQKMQVRFRVDGKLLDYIRTGNEIFASVCSRIKFIGGMSIAEKRIPQDGRATYNSGGHNIDMRISTLPGVFGEKIVIRITTSLTFNMKKEALGFSEHNLEVYERLIHKPFGIVLVTGPTGSGKSTTLYTALAARATSDINVITVENPVEMIVPNITQVNINPAQGLTFPAVLRSVLRQDPDVVMIGEIRDEETADIATAMSITGHLVFSTLHTYDAPSSIVRLIDMGIQPFMVSSSVIGVISQRLLRRLCPNCKEPYQATAEEKKALHVDPAQALTLYKPCGCAKCMNTGFSGRTAVGEIMEVRGKLRSSISSNLSSDALRQLALEEGMVPMAEDVRGVILRGDSTLAEAMQIVDLTE